MSKRSKNARKVRRIVYWTCVVCLVLVILVCLGLIAHKVITDVLSDRQYQELEALKESVSTEQTRPPIPSEITDPTETEAVETEPTETGPEGDPDAPKILPEYQLIYDLNPDTVGWIQLPGTRIDYPVVQTPDDPNFYLRRNFYKENATCGTIYARAKCDINTPSDNVTLYGHNMRNGTMFADLHLYEEKSYWMDNRYIYFDTLYEYHTYEVFAVFVGTADLTLGFAFHIFDNAISEVDYDLFVQNCKRLSLYDTGITPKLGEKLLTLSTCDKSQDEGRFVVVARRVV